MLRIFKMRACVTFVFIILQKPKKQLGAFESKATNMKKVPNYLLLIRLVALVKTRLINLLDSWLVCQSVSD